MLEFLRRRRMFGYETDRMEGERQYESRAGLSRSRRKSSLYKLERSLSTADADRSLLRATEIPQYDFTLSVDSLGDEGDGGTVSAEITRKGMRAYKRENLDAGKHSVYRDSDITITAVPSAGYRVQDWTINGQTTADTAVSKIADNSAG